MTSPILVLQTISTVWSKAARGGALAQVRNAVPLALPLPLQQSTQILASVHHDAQFLEHEQWYTPHQRITFDSLMYPNTVGCVTVERSSSRLWVTYRYTYKHGGAPYRHNEHKMFVTDVDQWVQLRWNGRFAASWDGGWWYEHNVVNVGLFATVTPKVFTRGAPIASYQSLQQIRSYPGRY